MWFALLFLTACSQYNDSPEVQKATEAVLEKCCFKLPNGERNEQDFQHLHEIYDNPEVQDNMKKTQAERETTFAQMYSDMKDVKNDPNASADQKIEEELKQIRFFLDELAQRNGNSLQYGLISKPERAEIISAIKEKYPQGAQEPDDFKVFFNVLRAELVVKGTDHLRENEAKAAAGGAAQNNGGEAQQQASSQANASPQQPASSQQTPQQPASSEQQKTPESQPASNTDSGSSDQGQQPNNNAAKSHSAKSAAGSLVNSLDLNSLRIRWALGLLFGMTILFVSCCYMTEKKVDTIYTLIEDEI